MPITIAAITPGFVAEIGCIDLRWPRDMMRDTTSDRPEALGAVERESATSIEH